jgi:hypothetical protein
MISRREAMGAGLLATFTTPPAPEATQSRGDDAETAKALKGLGDEMRSISTTLEQGLVGPSVAAGAIGRIRERLSIHMKTAGKFPEFMEIGLNVFYEVYDWHVRYQQQIQITRIAEQRFAIQFMFTQLIVRWEQDNNYLGVPFDR